MPLIVHKQQFGGETALFPYCRSSASRSKNNTRKTTNSGLLLLVIVPTLLLFRPIITPPPQFVVALRVQELVKRVHSCQVILQQRHVQPLWYPVSSFRWFLRYHMSTPQTVCASGTTSAIESINAQYHREPPRPPCIVLRLFQRKLYPLG